MYKHENKPFVFLFFEAVRKSINCSHTIFFSKKQTSIDVIGAILVLINTYLAIKGTKKGPPPQPPQECHVTIQHSNYTITITIPNE